MFLSTRCRRGADFFCAGSAAAQTATASSWSPAVQQISLNPITTTFGWYTAEYQRSIDATKTWGVSGSYLSFSDASYRNLTGTFRYYPRAAMSGFYLGGRVGVHRIGNDFGSGTFLGAGPDIGDSWRLGAKQNVGIAMGIGAMRLFGGDLQVVSFTIPTLRLIDVGIAF
jgi:hypothetical protein